MVTSTVFTSHPLAMWEILKITEAVFICAGEAIIPLEIGVVWLSASMVGQKRTALAELHTRSLWKTLFSLMATCSKLLANKLIKRPFTEAIRVVHGGTSQENPLLVNCPLLIQANLLLVVFKLLASRYLQILRITVNQRKFSLAAL